MVSILATRFQSHADTACITRKRRLSLPQSGCQGAVRATGQQIDGHLVRLTGSPALHEGRLYVPTSSAGPGNLLGNLLCAVAALS
jgi:hypothetical protein